MISTQDAAERLNQRNVGIGLLSFTPLPSPKIISQFRDLADVKAALLATSCIPLYFSPSPVSFFRGFPAIDGFFSTKRSDFGAPATTATITVRVAPFDADLVRLDGISISPSSNDDLSALLKCALGSPPVDDTYLIDLFDKGQADADRWLESGGLDLALATAAGARL